MTLVASAEAHEQNDGMMIMTSIMLDLDIHTIADAQHGNLLLLDPVKKPSRQGWSSLNVH